MAGDSGGVLGNKVAVGEGGAKTLDKKRARLSTDGKIENKVRILDGTSWINNLTLLALVHFECNLLAKVG